MRKIGITFAALVAGCGPNTEQTLATDNTMVSDMAADMPVGSVEAGADSDPWTIEDSIDPITDARLLRASIKVLGGADDVEVTASCNPSEPSVTYAVSGFDKEGEGARLDTNFVGGSPFNRVVYRPDNRPAQTAITINPQYNNQGTIADDQGFDAANARQLTLRIQFANANETYSIDQSSQGFQKVVRRCLEARAANAQLEQRRAAAAVRAREEQAAAQEKPAENAPEDLMPNEAGTTDNTE